MSVQDFQVLQRGEDDKALGLAVGGPYTVDGAKEVFVGDLWVLAGQSNMEGVGDLVDVESPSPFVHSFQSREAWAVAEEPLHWLGESPRFVHHQLWGRQTMPDRPDPRDPNRDKGAGLGLAFAKAYHEQTGVPVGLIPSAHGGTSMDQWNPALKAQAGDSLYGATYQRFLGVGGRVKGVLWYQGESDASPEGAARYADGMQKLIAAFRSDFGQPDLPFFLVQLGRVIADPMPEMVEGWNAVREAQRRLPASVPHTAVVSALDLELDDGIHIGVHGLKRLGRRMTAVACGRPAPDVARVAWDGDSRLRITFHNVQGHLKSDGNPSGFTVRASDGKKAHVIYKTALEGNSAVLHLTEPQRLRQGPLNLWYGYGLDPYCNITDADDQAILAFGPHPLKNLS